MVYFFKPYFSIQSQCKTPGKIKIKCVMDGAETRVFAKLRSSLPKQKPDRKRTGLAWSRVVVYP
jgi:hypothetical protein